MPVSRVEERRAHVRQLLEAGQEITYTDRKALGEQFGCTQRTIYRDIEIIQGKEERDTGVFKVDDFGYAVDNRDIEVLRALGRLGVLNSQMIYNLFFADSTRQTMMRHLNKLYEEGRVWRTRIANYQQTYDAKTGKKVNAPPLKQPYVWGLTPEGRELIEAADAEVSERTYALLHTRDRRGIANINKGQLKHDLLMSSWCASVVDAARRCRLLHSIFCHVEYVSHERQRIDGLLILIFDRSKQKHNLPGWKIPWYDYTPPGGKSTAVRFALEADRGTESLGVLLGKAATYRELIVNGHYKHIVGGPVIPVFITPLVKRAAQIAMKWQNAWSDDGQLLPNTPGLVSSPECSTHPKWGALWGEYFRLRDDPQDWATNTVRPLDGIFKDLDAWKETCEGWMINE